MIRHVALFRFAPTMPEAAIAEVLREFEALNGQIPGLLDIRAGPNESPEGLDQGFRHGIIGDFESPDAFQAYLMHPLHQAVARKVIGCLSNGIEADVVAFDLTVRS